MPACPLCYGVSEQPVVRRDLAASSDTAFLDEPLNPSSVLACLQRRGPECRQRCQRKEVGS